MKTSAMAILVGLTACSGAGGADLFAEGGTLAGDGGAGLDAAAPDGGLASPVCPRADPGDGAPCARPGLACEYGTDPNSNCNAVRTCSTRGVWESSRQGALCPTAPALHDPRCPASRIEGAKGAACPATAVSASCGFAGEGRCACAPAQAAADAGAGGSHRWVCDTPAATCPLPRPRLGEACGARNAGQLCNYGACVLDGGQQLVCLDGYWQRSRFDCSASAR